MKNRKKILLPLFIIFISSLFSFEKIEAKNVLIFSAGGPNIPTYLGLFRAIQEQLQERNENIDIVIGTCGGSVSAAIASRLPSHEFLDFMKSHEIHEFFKAQENTLDQKALFPFMRNQLRMSFFHKWEKLPLLPSLKFPKPNLFSYSMTKKAPEFPLPEEASSLDHPLKSIILAYEIIKDEKKGEIISYKETSFTDKETAREISPHCSRVKEMTGEACLISKETQIITGVSVEDAIRASISDPNFYPPALIQGRFFTTGAITSDALDLAFSLKKKDEKLRIFITKRDLWNYKPQRYLMERAYHFDPNVYQESINKIKLGPKYKDGVELVVVDFHDMNSNPKLPSLSPKMNFKIQAKNILSPKKWATQSIEHLRKFEDFQEAIQARFEYGYARGYAVKIN